MSDVKINFLEGKNTVPQGLAAISKSAEGATTSFEDLVHMGGSLSLVGGALLEVGGAVLDATAEIFSFSTGVDQSLKNLQTELGLSEQAASKLNESAIAVFSNNFTDSVEEAGQLVTQVYQRMGDIGEQQTTRLAGQVQAVSDKWGIDTVDSLSAVDTLMKEFSLTSDEAINLYVQGLQKGLDNSGDFVDSINEYSLQFSNAGADATAMFALFESGMQNGMLGTDKAADLFKEFSIRVMEDSEDVNSALLQLGDSIDQDVIQGLEDGSVTATEVFQQVIEGLNNIEDPIERNRIATDLMGTQYEDLGDKATLALSTMTDSFNESADVTESLGVQYENLGEVWEGIKRKTLIALSPITDVILDLANKHLPKFLKIIEDTFTKAAPYIVMFAEGIEVMFNWIGSSINQLTAFWNNFNTGKSSLDGVWDSIIGFTSSLGINEEVMLDLKEAVTGLFNQLVNLKDKFVELVTPLINFINENVDLQDVLTVIGNILSVTLVPAFELIIIAYTNIIEVIGTLISWYAALLGALIDLKNSWVNNYDQMIDKFGVFYSAISRITAAKDTFTIGVGKIIEAGTNMKNSISTVSSLVTDSVLKMFNDKITLEDASTSYFGIVPTVLNRLIVPDYFNSRTRSALSSLESALNEKFPNTRGAMESGINSVLGVFEGGFSPQKFYDVASTGINRVRDAINDRIWDVTSKTQSLVDQVYRIFTDKFNTGTLYNVGRDLMQGLINGIDSLIQVVKNKITGLGDGMLADLKWILGINSPSEETQEIAKHFMSPLENMDFSKILSNVRSLGDKMLVELNPNTIGIPQNGNSSQTSNSVNNNRTINIYVDGSRGILPDIEAGVNELFNRYESNLVNA